MTHTPGPWKVWAYWQVGPEDSLPGDTVVAHCHEDAHRGRGIEEVSANARLIAAAPDLLELIKLYVRYTERECWNVPFRKACLSAIAKSEGRD